MDSEKTETKSAIRELMSKINSKNDALSVELEKLKAVISPFSDNATAVASGNGEKEQLKFFCEVEEWLVNELDFLDKVTSNVTEMTSKVRI